MAISHLLNAVVMIIMALGVVLALIFAFSTKEFREYKLKGWGIFISAVVVLFGGLQYYLSNKNDADNAKNVDTANSKIDNLTRNDSILKLNDADLKHQINILKNEYEVDSNKRNKNIVVKMPSEIEKPIFDLMPGQLINRLNPQLSYDSSGYKYNFYIAYHTINHLLVTNIGMRWIDVGYYEGKCIILYTGKWITLKHQSYHDELYFEVSQLISSTTIPFKDRFIVCDMRYSNRNNTFTDLNRRIYKIEDKVVGKEMITASDADYDRILPILPK